MQNNFFYLLNRNKRINICTLLYFLYKQKPYEKNKYLFIVYRRLTVKTIILILLLFFFVFLPQKKLQKYNNNNDRNHKLKDELVILTYFAFSSLLTAAQL